MNSRTSIYDYITSEETAYEQKVPIVDGYDWSMKEHIQTTILYKNSQLKTGKTDDKPVKNILLPILRLQYRTEGFDVKDIGIFVDDKDEYYKTLLVRKSHEKFARENGLDTVIDETVEAYVDFGGALLKDVNDTKPELVPWQSIAFCDQTDFMSGPFAIKHYYSPDQLLDMASAGWGDTANGATATLEEVIELARSEKKDKSRDDEVARTPGKYVEVYEVHGNMPLSFLDDSESTKYQKQLQIVTFLKKKNGKKQGITLYRAKEPKLPFKLILRDKIYGRALGLGGAEELFEPQVWVTYDQIRMKGLLDAASKVVLQSDDPTIANKHPGGLKDIENLEIIDVDAGKMIQQIQTTPVSIGLFEKSISEWEAHAQMLGAANDSILGENPTAGTPFKLQELVTQEAHGIHAYRQGKLATFWDEVERDWIIPRLVKEMSQGQQFLAELELDELQQVADSLITCEANKAIKKNILAGKTVDPEMVDTFKQAVRDQFMKGGNKRFIEIFKGEMKDVPIDCYTNIAGKQKDLAGMVDKITNIMRFVFSTYNPQTNSFAAFDDARMAKFLNMALEYSNMEPIDTYSKPPAPAQLPPPQPGQAIPGQPSGAPVPSPIGAPMPANAAPAVPAQ